MRLLLKLLLLTLVGLPILAVIALWLCFQDQPTVARTADITPADIEKAKAILKKHDPRKAKSGTLRTIAISQPDAELALNYAISRFRKGSARVVMQPGVGMVQASIELPGNPLGKWINVDAAVRETGALPDFDRLRIGSLPVPAFIANFALARALGHLNEREEGKLANDVVKSVKLADGRVQVVYEWRADLPDRVRAIAVPPADQERYKAYNDRLVEEIDRLRQPGGVSLSRLLPPMFALARERSAGGDAAKENRAAIVNLALYSNGRGLQALIPAAKAWRRPAPRKVTLYERDDFPQHFLISAAIAAEGGGPLADAIGLYKEVADSRGGTGFSFNDIAADRAGTRFGELAVKSPQKLQGLLAGGIKEPEFMPDVSDLPEFMQEDEFKRRYGGIGAPAYNRMMTEIESRIAARRIFRP